MSDKMEETIIRQTFSLERAAVRGEEIEVKEIPDLFTIGVEPRAASVIEQETIRLQQDLAWLRQEHQSTMRKLLSVEATLATALNEAYQKRDEELRQKVAALSLEAQLGPLDERFPRIDMKFMDKRQWVEKGLRYSCALPLFAVFSVYCPKCILTFDKALMDNQGLKDLFLVSAKELGSFKHSFNKPCIAAIFQGGVPGEVRQDVSLNRQMFDDMILVTRAPGWSVEAEPAPQPISQSCDALLVGRKDKVYWLIRSFRTIAHSEFGV